MHLDSQSGFFELFRCLSPTPGLTSEYPACSVCARVNIRTDAPTYTHPPSKIQKGLTTLVSFRMSNNPSHQPATSPLRRLSEHPQPRPPSLINKLHVHGSHVHTLQRVCSQIRTLVLTDTCGAYTLAHAQVLKTFV